MGSFMLFHFFTKYCEPNCTNSIKRTSGTSSISGNNNALDILHMQFTNNGGNSNKGGYRIVEKSQSVPHSGKFFVVYR